MIRLVGDTVSDGYCGCWECSVVFLSLCTGVWYHETRMMGDMVSGGYS